MKLYKRPSPAYRRDQEDTEKPKQFYYFEQQNPLLVANVKALLPGQKDK